MQHIMLKSKIHRATVTDANMDYEGSISIDRRLMEEAQFLPYEKVAISNANNGERFETYVIPGKDGEICINGPAAHKASTGDIIVIFSYAVYETEEAVNHKPIILKVDKENNLVSKHREVADKAVV